MRVVDTSAWVEWLRDLELGRKVGLEMPALEAWIVPTIVQYELARWLAQEFSKTRRTARSRFRTSAS